MSDKDIVTAVTKFRELYETKGIFDCRPYPGLDMLLPSAVESGHILAVASSKPEPFVKEIISHFGFAPFFSVICGSDIGDELKSGLLSARKPVSSESYGKLEEKDMPIMTCGSTP